MLIEILGGDSYREHRRYVDVEAMQIATVIY
jgi:hypothetical protein